MDQSVNRSYALPIALFLLAVAALFVMRALTTTAEAVVSSSATATTAAITATAATTVAAAYKTSTSAEVAIITEGFILEASWWQSRPSNPNSPSRQKVKNLHDLAHEAGISVNLVDYILPKVNDIKRRLNNCDDRSSAQEAAFEEAGRGLGALYKSYSTSNNKMAPAGARLVILTLDALAALIKGRCASIYVDALMRGFTKGSGMLL